MSIELKNAVVDEDILTVFSGIQNSATVGDMFWNDTPGHKDTLSIQLKT
jgi:hypothetical protein